MLYYISWISLIIVFYIFYTYVSHQNNLHGGKWMWILLLLGIFPGWVIISRYSKNLMFDGMLYDVIMFLTYAVFIGFLTGQFLKFNWSQWIGFIMILTGFILMRMKI